MAGLRGAAACSPVVTLVLLRRRGCEPFLLCLNMCRSLFMHDSVHLCNATKGDSQQRSSALMCTPDAHRHVFCCGTQRVQYGSQYPAPQQDRR